MKKIRSVNDILNDPKWREAWVEMVETDALGRRILLGFKRRSKRSRKKRVVFLCPGPIFLDDITREYEAAKLKVAADEAASAQSNRAADEHDDAAVVAARKDDLAPG